MQSTSAAARRVARMFYVARGARLAAFAAAAVGFAGCQDKHEWHQKLTVVVDTPTGEVSGSSVIAINATFGDVPFSDKEVWCRIRGEATVAELAPGRYLFALLGDDEERYYRAVRDQLKDMGRGEWLKRIPEMKGVVTLKPRNFPLLVTFRDVDDSESVLKVDPNDLAATFGPGFKLDRITLEITDEPVTTHKVEQILPWLEAIWPNKLDGRRYETSKAQNRLANSLSANSFSTEAGK